MRNMRKISSFLMANAGRIFLSNDFIFYVLYTPRLRVYLAVHGCELIKKMDVFHF